MNKTKHLISRMSQRAVDQSLIEITCRYGQRDHRNRILLNMNEIDTQLTALESKKQALLEARKKGGVVVVEDRGILVTTYIRGRSNGLGRRGR